jgi:hypothetical protein
LFEFEHVVIEKLLELLVGVVNTDLFEAVLLEDFETGNIENTNEESSLFGVQDLVHSSDDPQEKTSVTPVLGCTPKQPDSWRRGSFGGLARSGTAGSFKTISSTSKVGSQLRLDRPKQQHLEQSASCLPKVAP